MKYTGLGLIVVVAASAYALRGTNSARSEPAARPTVSTSPTTAPVRAEGRVVVYPGASVDVGTETGGRIVKLYVEEQQRVHRGDVIADFASDEQRAALSEAQARVTEVNSDIAFLTTELQRIAVLAKSASVSQQSLDKATRDLDAAKAQQALALATVSRIEAQIAKLRVLSPIEGTITARFPQSGETVHAGSRLVTVTDLARRRVEAEIDEFDAGRIRLGAKTDIRAEGYDDQSWTGAIELVPDVVVPRQLKPQDPSRPSDTRILLVKITLPKDAPFKVGQRVEVAVEPASAK